LSHHFVQSGCNLLPSKFVPIISGGSNRNLIPVSPPGADNAFLSHPSYWASDASHLVPCSAGDAIRWWKDAVTGTWYEQATSGNRFIARQDVTGKWYAEGTGTQQHPWIDLSVFPSTNATFAAAYRIYASTAYGMLISNATNSTTAVRELRESSTTLAIQTLGSNTGTAATDPTADTVNVDYRHIGTLGTGVNGTTLYQNGASVAQIANDTQTGNFATNTVVGGRTGTSSFNHKGRFYGLLISTSNTINVATWDAALHGYCTA